MIFQKLQSLRLLIFEPVCLINHDIDEGDLLEYRVQVGHEHLEGGYHDIELI